MIPLIAIRKVASAIPAWVYSALILFAFGFYLGHSRMVEKFDKYKLAQTQVVQALEKKSADITTVEVTKYVDRIQVVREAGKTITKKVNVYVPRNVCILPPGFRSVHDAAATGRVLPDSPGDTHAAPVDAQDVAGTVTDNYRQARENAEQLIALQNWVKAQQKSQSK